MATGPYEPGADPDDSTVDNDDNGTANGNNERSAVFTVRVGMMPTGEPDTVMPTGVTNPAIDANSNLTIDFGLFDEGQIGDQVWLDANGNGIQDTGETTYIAGVTVTIYNAATNQPLDGDPNTPGIQPITRTSVAAATSYLFNRLIAGTYYWYSVTFLLSMLSVHLIRVVMIHSTQMSIRSPCERPISHLATPTIMI
jgi:hypothetical protein